MQKENIKESDKDAAGSHSLTDSPYVGGNKMSSSLKDKLKRFRKYSRPISKPNSAVSRSIQLEFNPHEYSKEDIEKAMNEPTEFELPAPEFSREELEKAMNETTSLIDESPCSNSEEFMNKPTEFELVAHEYSKEDIEKAMNEPTSLIDESPCSNSEEFIKICMDEPPHSLSKSNTPPTSMKITNENASSNPNEFAEIYMEVTEPDENDCSLMKNDIDKSGTKLNESFCSVSLKNLVKVNDKSDPEIKDVSCSVKEEIDVHFDKGNEKSDNEIEIVFCNIKNETDIHEPSIKAKEYMFPYSKKDIENCADEKTLMEIFKNLQKEYTKNEEKLRKLKLVQKHHNKNSPDDLKSLNQKWLTCTQSALRKLYSFMPDPRSITFENFLIFLQVDFNAIKYNPETDTFS